MRLNVEREKEEKTMWVYNVLDISGSMGMRGNLGDRITKFDAAVAGINEDLGTMKKDTTGVRFKVAVIEFNGDYSDGKYYSYVCKPDYIENVVYKHGRPNNNTPLYATIGSVLEDIIKIKPKEDPCIVTVFTDGGENSSRGSKYHDPGVLRGFIAECEKENISVKFVGTHHDVLSMNHNLGVSMSNMVSYDGSSAQLGATFTANSEAKGRMSKSYAGGASADSLTRGVYFSQEDRDIVNNANKKEAKKDNKENKKEDGNK